MHGPQSPAEWQAQELTLLHRVRDAVTRDLDLTRIYRNVVEQVKEVFGYSHVSLYTLEASELVLQHQVGYDSVIDRIPIDRGVAGRVVRTARPHLIEDVSADPAFLAAVPDIRSEVCVPFFREGLVAGVLNVETTGDRTLDERDLRLMAAVSGYLALAVERSALHAAKIATEERLRIALEAAEMGAWEWYPQSGEVHWSEQMAPLYGLAPGTLSITAEEWLELIHPDDREMVQRSDRNFLQHGDDYELEFRIVLPSGVVRWLSGKGRVVERDAAGQVTAAVGVTMDITGRKRLEEERVRLAQAEAERIKAQEAERQITRTLERMTAGFMAVDRDWRFTYLNPRAAALFGRAGHDFRAKVLWDEFPEVQDSQMEVALREAARTQRPWDFDFRWPLIGRWLEVHVYPDEEGLSIYFQDVTDQRRAEEEQRRVEARFRALVQHASDIIVILARDGVVKYVSPAVERVLGLAPDEVVGSDNFFRVHPLDAKRLRAAFVQVVKRAGVSSPLVLRFRHKTGSYRWLEVTPTNLLDDPAVEGIVANCRDVTERYQIEYNLWFLAETSSVLGASLDLETTLSNLARLIVMHLGDACLVDVVDEEIEAMAAAVGHRDGEIERALTRLRRLHPIGSNLDGGPERVLTAGRALVRSTVDEAFPILFGATLPAEDRFETGIKSVVIVPLTARGARVGVLTIGSQTPGRFTGDDLGLIEELGRRAALAVDNALLYRAARTAIEARDQFLSVAAHELRTPITAISGFVSLIDREMNLRNDPERLQKYVRRLKDSGHRLSGLVDDLLDVSNIRRGALPLRIAEIDLNQLLRRVSQRYDEPHLAGLHRIDLDLPDSPVCVQGDDDRLEQVVTNVLENAVKYSPEGGRITVILREEDDGVRVDVRDEGIGMSGDEIESVFRPFGRTATAIEGHFPGMGIGLHICENIVERHGGRIWAESPGPGRGTTLSFWLPKDATTDAKEKGTARADT